MQGMQLERLLTAACLGNGFYLLAGGDERGNPHPHDRVIVNNENPDGRHKQTDYKA